MGLGIAKSFWTEKPLVKPSEKGVEKKIKIKISTPVSRHFLKFSETGSCYVAQAGLGFVILPPQSSE
jgi:hypothetical protein